MGVKVINIWQCAADTEETFGQELKRLVEASVGEDGCVSCEIYQPADKHGEYVTIEEWEDDDALNNHRETPHYKHFVRISPVLQKGPPDSRQLIKLF